MYVLTELKQENERHDNFKKWTSMQQTKNKPFPKLNFLDIRKWLHFFSQKKGWEPLKSELLLLLEQAIWMSFVGTAN